MPLHTENRRRGIAGQKKYESHRHGASVPNQSTEVIQGGFGRKVSIPFLAENDNLIDCKVKVHRQLLMVEVGNIIVSDQVAKHIVSLSIIECS